MIEFNLTDYEYEEAVLVLKNSIKTEGVEEYIINFKADFSNSKIIRDFVWEVFDAFSIHHPWRGRFILIADELINNAIEHGSLPGDIDQCIVTAGRREEDGRRFFISFEVHDTGKWKANKPQNMEKIKEAKMNLSETENTIYMEKRGRGLFHITDKIVDKLTFGESKKGGLAVKVEKCIDDEENWIGWR